jgi:hypothetical protein
LVLLSQPLKHRRVGGVAGLGLLDHRQRWQRSVRMFCGDPTFGEYLRMRQTMVPWKDEKYRRRVEAKPTYANTSRHPVACHCTVQWEYLSTLKSPFPLISRANDLILVAIRLWSLPSTFST